MSWKWLSKFIQKRGGWSPSSGDPVLVQLFGGNESSAGIRVTPDEAIKLSSVHACIKILSEAVAQLPLYLYRQIDENSKTLARDNPLYNLFLRAPNPLMTASVFKRTMMWNLLCDGNAYAQKQRLPDGTVIGLWPWDTKNVRPEIKGWNLNYYFRGENGQEVPVPAEEVFHLRDASRNGLIGESVVSRALNSIGMGIAAEQYGARFFKNDARPTIVLSAPGTLTEAQQNRLRESWKSQFGGGGQHGTAVLESGLKPEKIGIEPEQAQFLETRKFQVADIARFFRIPLHMLDDLDKSSFCLPADVEVFTEKGPKSIAETQIGERVWSLSSEGKMVLSSVKESRKTGEDKILKIKTTNRTIRVNSKHRMYVRKKHKFIELTGKAGNCYRMEWKNEFIPAGELKVGETLIVLKNLPENLSQKIPEVSIGMMEFLGMYLGNGSKSTGQISIARNEKSGYMDHYRKIMQKEFTCNDGGNGRENNHPPQKSICFIERKNSTKFSSASASRKVSELGFDGTAHTKRVPEWIFSLSHKYQLAFLRGFLDSDGSVDKKGRISFSSCNEKMLSQIRHLCMNLEIPVTNLRKQEGKSRLPNGRIFNFTHYYFTCSDPGNNKKIGTYTPKYIERLNAGKPFDKKGRNYPFFGGRDFNIENCELSKIISIEEDGFEPVYDLEVEDSHTFIANGIIVHNSNIEMQSLEFIIYTLVPWLTLWEEEIERSILNDPVYSVSFDVDQFLRGDISSRYAAYATGRQWGWLSVNDIRREEKMNPIDGGDNYLTPLNMTPSNQPAQNQLNSEVENASKKETVSDEFGVSIRHRISSGTNGNGQNHKRLCSSL